MLKVKISYLIFLVLFVAISSCQFNKTRSINLNRFSAVTHCNQSLIQSWSCKICKQGQLLKQIIYISNNLTDAMGFLGYWEEEDRIVVSMRGTVDVKNWIQDFSFYQLPYYACKNCMIHQGFYGDYLSIANRTLNGVKTLLQKHKTAKIYVTGSSLGGALATVAAIQLQLALGLVDQLHAYGCPRVGNQNLAQFIKIKIPSLYRVIHNKDIVPHVPLQTQNYHHPANQIWFDSSMETYKICDDSGEDVNCSDSLYPNYLVTDHTSYWYKPVQEDVCTP